MTAGRERLTSNDAGQAGVLRRVSLGCAWLGWLASLALAACVQEPQATTLLPPTDPATVRAETGPLLLPTPTGTFVAEVIAPTPTLTREPLPESMDIHPEPATPTGAARLDPKSWREWPVVPTLEPAMLEVYLRGIRLGNDSHAFAKVGDCQNIPNAFLGVYDNPERYRLHPDYAYLQETIDWYAGYFVRDGAAVEGGFNFPAVFSPLRADGQLCEPGETPLQCEFRLLRPSVVFISMEFWYEGRTAEDYGDYLRRTVEFALEHGAVPILSTKADNVEGDHSINLTTAQVAAEYHVPLWNFWLAAQPLPRHGIDWERDPDGFHITYEAWNWRSFTALQTLDALWRQTAPLRATYSSEEAEYEQ